MPKLYLFTFSLCFSLGYYKLSISNSELGAGVRIIDNVSYRVIFLLLRCNNRYHLSCRTPSPAKRRSTRKVKKPSELSASHRSSTLESPIEQDGGAFRQVPVPSCSLLDSVFPQQVLLVLKMYLKCSNTRNEEELHLSDTSSSSSPGAPRPPQKATSSTPHKEKWQVKTIYIQRQRYKTKSFRTID